MNKLLCPSLMCADYRELANTVKVLDEAGIDIFHCDIMDGNFVPNITMGLMDVKAVRASTNKLVDCHLMIKNPSEKVDWFIDAGADIIYIHYEADEKVKETLQHIHERGKKAGLAINPETQLEDVKDLLEDCDYILVMSVHPGFSGQKFIKETDDKVKQFIQIQKDYSYKIVVDGGCSPAVIERLSAVGVNGFVLGSASLFGKDKSYSEIIKELRKL